MHVASRMPLLVLALLMLPASAAVAEPTNLVASCGTLRVGGTEMCIADPPVSGQNLPVDQSHYQRAYDAGLGWAVSTVDRQEAKGGLVEASASRDGGMIVEVSFLAAMNEAYAEQRRSSNVASAALPESSPAAGVDAAATDLRVALNDPADVAFKPWFAVPEESTDGDAPFGLFGDDPELPLLLSLRETPGPVATPPVRYTSVGTPAPRSTSGSAGALHTASTDAPRAASHASGLDAATVVGLVVTAGLLAVLAKFVILPLYSRLSRDETLDNDTRKGIYGAVVANPGICISDAAKTANISHSTAAYHLERLVETRMLVQVGDGNKLRFYKNSGRFTDDERRLAPIFKSPELLRILEYIAQNPWCYRAEIAMDLGVTATTVNWHLRKLFGSRLVHESREGRNVYLYVDKERLSEALANLGTKLGDAEVHAADIRARLLPERPTGFGPAPQAPEAFAAMPLAPTA